MERQRTEQLQDLVQDLSDVIVELHEQIQTQSQQIEALCEQLQGADDLPKSPAHCSQPNSLNQDTDAQNSHSFSEPLKGLCLIGVGIVCGVHFSYLLPILQHSRTNLFPLSFFRKYGMIRNM